MSASTASITANTVSRRRAVVPVERKKGVELLNDNGVSVAVSQRANKTDSAAADDKVGGNSKDLSHSIRGETVLERSKEAIQVNKLQPTTSTISPRRNRKPGATPKAEKPRWQTVLSVCTKNFLLLLVIVGLFQIVRRIVTGARSDLSGGLMGFSEMEGRIAEVESYVKKTTKMMQVQVEAVNKKIEYGIGDLREEINAKLEEKNKEFADELQKLDGKSEELENALSQLANRDDLLSKESFAEFYDLFRKSKGRDLGGSDSTLDEIRAVARQIVEKEIDRHAADGLGQVDYALASGGAAVVKHSDPFVGKGSNWFSVTNRQRVHSEAEKMLKPSFGEPGQCFPLKGSNGFVDIKLRTSIIPQAVTLEHVSQSVAYDRSSAPKDCKVYGWLQGAQQALDTSSAADDEKMSLLTEFSYDLEKSNAQTFNVHDSTDSSVVDTIRFDFTSNHGSPSHTCIYRLRVHGREPSSVSVVA